jgi:hypothetical protein
MIAQLPDMVTAALWALVAFSVLVVVRAVWFGVRGLRGLAETASHTKRLLADAQATLASDRAEMQHRLASLRTRADTKD